ncbi:MAG: PDZ domain-containing protein [Bacteroidota bacterium]
MKQYFLKIAGALAFAFITTGALAQEDAKESSTTTIHRNDDIIIIKPKTNVDTKINIEIKGGDVMVNGKPLSEYKSDDVSISKRKQMQLEIDNMRLGELQAAPRTRFRGGANAYGYGSSDNMTITTSNGNKAFLGVGTEKNEEGEGVTVTSVSDESAAEKAGLKEGDIITKLNDVKVNTPGELTKAIGKFNPDEKVTVTYKRDKKEQKATAVLMKRKSSSFTLNAPYQAYKNFNFDNNNFNFSWGKPRLGLKAQETEDGKGLKVLDVDDESAAEKAGIKEGDIITTFDGTEVNNIDKLRELSKAAIDKGHFMVKLTRDGKLQELEVKIPKDLKTGSL